jgi:uncharacterized membrane-anchored protein
MLMRTVERDRKRIADIEKKLWDERIEYDSEISARKLVWSSAKDELEKNHTPRSSHILPSEYWI